MRLVSTVEYILLYIVWWTTDAVLMSTSMQSLKCNIFELKSTTGPQQKPQVNKENDVGGTESAGSKVNLAACLSLG